MPEHVAGTELPPSQPADTGTGPIESVSSGSGSAAIAESRDRASGILLTLDRGIRVLEAIGSRQGRATARELGTALGINPGTCYQLLRTLQVNGYVLRLPGGRYSLGPQVMQLADQYESESAPPPELVAALRELHAGTGESVYIAIRRSSRIVISAVFEGTQAVRVGPLQVGFSDHPHARATGKAFLALTDSREVDTFLGNGALHALTPRTITDRGAFRAELNRIRSRGYAIDIEEFAAGVACIGTAVLGADGAPYGSMGVSLPVSRLPQLQEHLVELALAAGEKASRLLGYTGPYPPPPVPASP